MKPPVKKRLPERPSAETPAPARGGTPARFYLPQLDGLRFVAFLLVFWHHLPLPAVSALAPNDALRSVFLRTRLFGWMGVDLFFCLSAFLITSLLLREQAATGRLSLKRFYIRRALRIWPLYFVMISLVFLVLPIFGYLGPALGSPVHVTLVRQQLLPFLAFLGNFSYATFTSSITEPLGPLWSISVEEQFYLSWPVLISLVPRMRKITLPAILCGLLALAWLTRLYIVTNAIAYPMIWVNTLARFDPLLLGTGVAVLYASGKRIASPWLALAASLLVYLVLTGFPQIGESPHTVWQLFATALACSLFLIAVIHGRLARPLLGNPVFRWAGKLSYGFYVFHKIGIGIANSVTAYSGSFKGIPDALVYVLVALSVTVVISVISYYAYERWFLLLKDRFTVVPSRAA